MGVYVIAEAGVNHNGNLNLAKELCLAAKESGADAVKFQTWVTDKIITNTVKKAAYQEESSARGESQYEMLKRLELPYEAFREIKVYCDGIGITFASTADEADSLDFLLDIGIPFVKIGSGERGNVPYLRYMGSKGLPILLSTGMSTIEDVRGTINELKDGGADDITLLHCTTSYPCPYDQVNLNAMVTLSEEFGLPVGYSDHTMGIAVPIAAVALGAVVIEKHFTLDRNMEGPDHQASTEPHEFRQMVEEIRRVEIAMGDGKKRPMPDEMANSEVVLKRIVACKPIEKGQIISESDVAVKRNENGAPASKWNQVIGMRAERAYQLDEGIEITVS